MKEIRFHGRGGQGAVIASNILANAAFLEGKDVQAFPYFGVERRGAPVTAFVRVDDKPIRIKFFIYHPNFVIVLDESLLKAVDVTAGLQDPGIVVVNSNRTPEAMGMEGYKIATVDATAIALEHGLGSKVAPIVNTVMVGAFVTATDEMKLESVLAVIPDQVPIKAEENSQACKKAAETVKVYF
ncbi:MAG: 2-oxoacid:acceptor oxidoreductase family protein [Thermoplasmata archaeon]|nr:2-oxoacid:acceptor oxidoreductase family protein [Thermoplasmata archaeon]